MKIIEGKEKEYKDWFDQNNDAYGRRCFIYAEDWANRLEELIDNSNKTPQEVIEENALKTSYEADYDGVTGFMYSVAFNILIQSWKYGKELKSWKLGEDSQREEENKTTKSTIYDMFALGAAYRNRIKEEEN